MIKGKSTNIKLKWKVHDRWFMDPGENLRTVF